jgi:hypothetical protein
VIHGIGHPIPAINDLLGIVSVVYIALVILLLPNPDKDE